MTKSLVLFIILAITTSLTAQFKYSAGIGLGTSFNANYDEFNTLISDSGLKEVSNYWLPISYDLTFQVYPSIRLGYLRLSNALTPNRSSDDFFLSIIMQGVSIQSFFTFLKRFELNCGLVPLLAKAEFIQEFTAKTSLFQFSTSTRAGAKNRALGFYSWIGMRMFIRSSLALEGNIGYLRTKFKRDNWKSDGENNGVSGEIDLTRPFFKFGIIFGW